MLWEIVNGVLIVSEHALMIEPFSTVWEADDNEGKARARRLFKYVELVCSPKKSNPYFGYNEEDRPRKVKKEVFKDEHYPDTEFMIMCIDKYKELLDTYSPTYGTLTSGLVASEKLKQYFTDFEFSERTKTGMMIIKPKEVTAALKELPDVAKAIEVARNKVNFELTEESRTRSQRKIGQYER